MPILDTADTNKDFVRAHYMAALTVDFNADGKIFCWDVNFRWNSSLHQFILNLLLSEHFVFTADQCFLDGDSLTYVNDFQSNTSCINNLL
jgi:hypothetical protein